MSKGRLEAFSDGVLAIIITIMVLELRPPHSAELGALLAIAPQFLAYVLSFTHIAIYWNNHHHMFQLTDHVDGSILWANNFLLFCLSLIPFATAWMGEHYLEAAPVAIYGLALLLAGVAYYILEQRIIHLQGPNSRLAAAIGRDWKGKASPVLYVLGVGFAAYLAPISQAIYVLVALIWIVPDRRIERQLIKPDSDAE
jgi:TMEM175 potassium channel family protein